MTLNWCQLLVTGWLQAILGCLTLSPPTAGLAHVLAASQRFAGSHEQPPCELLRDESPIYVETMKTHYGGTGSEECVPLPLSADRCSVPARVLGHTALTQLPRHLPPDFAFPSRRTLELLLSVWYLACIESKPKNLQMNPPPDQGTCVISCNWSWPKSHGGSLVYRQERCFCVSGRASDVDLKTPGRSNIFNLMLYRILNLLYIAVSHLHIFSCVRRDRRFIQILISLTDGGDLCIWQLDITTVLCRGCLQGITEHLLEVSVSLDKFGVIRC